MDADRLFGLKSSSGELVPHDKANLPNYPGTVMRMIRWLMPAPKTPEQRHFSVIRQDWLAGLCDTIFRIVEMTGVLGLVKYLENKAGGSGLIFLALSGVFLTFILAKVGGSLYAAIDNFDLTERGKQVLYYVFWVTAWIAWGCALEVINLIIPLFVAHEGS